jgi:hypothetical protein
VSGRTYYACGSDHIQMPPFEAICEQERSTMSISQWHKMILVGAILSCVGFSSSALSRPWKPTAAQIAGDYASINHNRGNGDVVTIGWWAAPTARPGTQLVPIFEKYVLISVTHSHINLKEPATGLHFDNIDTLEVRDKSGNALTPVEQDALPPADIGLLATFEAGYRQGLGPRGKGTKFFVFDAGAVRACEKGGISVPYDGETYTWETPFPGCSAEAVKQEPRAVISQEPPAYLSQDTPAVVSREPSAGTLNFGERMLVDDGTEGTIKQIIGGNGVLTPRTRACIPR